MVKNPRQYACLVTHIRRISIPSGRNLRDFVAAILKLDAKSYFPPEAFFERNKNFFYGKPDYRDVGREIPNESDLSAQIQEQLSAILESDWTLDRLQGVVNKIISGILKDEQSTSEQEKAACEKRASNRVLHFLRQEIMGSKPGPAMSATMEILGRERTLERLRVGSQRREY